MKLTENTQYVKVAEYRSCITLLRECGDAFLGCCNNAERQGWRVRALHRLSQASSFRCRRAKPVDIQRFESACQRLQQGIDSVSTDGQLVHIV